MKAIVALLVLIGLWVVGDLLLSLSPGAMLLSGLGVFGMFGWISHLEHKRLADAVARNQDTYIADMLERRNRRG